MAQTLQTFYPNIKISATKQFHHPFVLSEFKESIRLVSAFFLVSIRLVVAFFLGSSSESVHALHRWHMKGT